MAMRSAGSAAPRSIVRAATSSGKAEAARGTAASSELTREINRDVLLSRVRTLQPVSRVDLARSSGLQPSTVSSIVEQLLTEGWIQESAALKTARGRRPTLLSLNGNVVILAADVRAGLATVALIDLNGRFLDRKIVPLGSDPMRALEDIASVMSEIRSKHSECTFEGVGISLQGRVDSETGRVLFTPNPAWAAVDLVNVLGSKLKMSVSLENAANASLLAELWFGSIKGVRNAVLLTISEGIGAAVLANDRLITGHTGMAGEFGHLCLDPEGPLCSCGSRGCWEVFASNRAAVRYYEELNRAAGRTSLLEIVSLSLDGDATAQEALAKQAQAIGQGLHLLNAILAPEFILIAGDVSLAAAGYMDIIERECKAGLMAGEGPTLVVMGDGEIQRLRGAAAVALQRHAGYYRARRTR